MKWHLKMLGYPQHKWAWSEDPPNAQPEIKKMTSREVFRLLLKHFRVVKSSELPTKNHPTYHPLRNINAGVKYLREKIDFKVVIWLEIVHRRGKGLE